MASRINTRFLLILSIAVMSGGALIGGLWFIQVRGDVTRSVRAGDEAFEAGNYFQARRYYGRALKKEPGRRDLLDKYVRAILDDTPQTQDTAGELYQMYLVALRHEATHFPLQSASHMPFLLEVRQAARLSGQGQYWSLLTSAADDMWSRVDPADPDRIKARLYRGIGTIQRAPLLTLAEIESGEQDLLVYVEEQPDSDLGWGSLVVARMVIARKLESEGQATTAAEALEEAEATVRQAVQQVPDGPYVNTVWLSWLLDRRAREEGSVTEEELEQAMTRVETLALQADDPRLVEEAALQVRRVRTLDGPARAQAMLRADLQQHPDDYKNRLLLVDTLYLADELDDAYANAGELMRSASLPAGLMARAQFEIRRRAAARRVDIDYRRWENAQPRDRAAVLSQMAEDYEQLVALVPDPEENPLVIKADAKLALARDEVTLAAARFEQFIAASNNPDFEALAYSAICQERIGQRGLAHERISQAVQLQPESVPLLLQKARLEVGMGRTDAAASTIEAARRLDPDNAQLLDFERQVAIRDRDPAAAPDDPISRALFEAQEAFSRGEVEEARGLLLGVLDERPHDVQVMEALARLEFNAGDKEAARRYLNRALEIEPSSQRLWALQASLDTDDPIAVVEEYIEISIPDERDRAVSLMRNLFALAEAQERLAATNEAAGNTENAERARDVARRARARAEAAQARAAELAPEHPQLLDHRFTVALESEDWAEAERVLEIARTTNADQVDGLMFRGRLAMVRGEFEEAVRLFEQVTSRLGYSAIAWKGLGYSYQQIGRTADALAAYEQAYERNPNDLSTIRRYAPLLVQSGQGLRALSILRPAAKLAPNDAGIRNMWLQLEAEHGDAGNALHVRRELLRTAPDDVDNALALASFLSNTDPAPSLLINDDGSLQVSSVQWAQLPTSQQEEILSEARAAWSREADQILDALATRDEGQTLLLAVMRAGILRNRGDAEAGARVLRDFIDAQPESARTAEMFTTLGTYLASIGLTDDAVAAMNEAMPYQSPDRLEADVALGNLYFETGQLEQSVVHLERVLEATGNREVGLRLVECYARLGQMDEADRRLQEQIQAGGRDYVTWMLTATIADARATEAFAAGQTTEGDRRILERNEALARAEKLDPSRVETYAAGARAALKDHQRTGGPTLLEQALVTLDRADRIDPGNVAISLVRVDVLLALGDPRGAISELTRALERSPRDSMVRRTLVQLLVNQREIDEAIAVAAAGEALAPGSPMWPELQGTLFATAKRDADAAAAAFRRAYELRPRTSLLASMVDAELGRATPDYRFVRTTIEQNPDALEANPVLRTLYARTVDALGDHEQALEELRVAYRDDRARAVAENEDPRNISNWYRVLGMIFEGRTAEAEQFARSVAEGGGDLHDDRWLAGMWASTGSEGLSRAIELQTRAIQACPADRPGLQAALSRRLSQYRIATGDYRAAADALARVIELAPDDAGARNDYAYLLAEFLDDSAAALPHAEHAVGLQPRNPVFLDTLGWIRFKLGDTAGAEESLLRSLDEAASAETMLHLAHVQVSGGDRERAERTLRRALESGPDPRTREEITRLLDDIRTGRSSGQ